MRRLFVLLMLALAICACSCSAARAVPSTSTPSPSASSPPPAAEQARGSVRLTIKVKPGLEVLTPPKGRLVVAWLSRDEYESVKREGPSAQLAYELLTSRIMPAGSIDLTSTGSAVREVNVPAGHLVLWGWLDVCGEFMRTAFGDGGCTGSLDGFAEHVESTPGRMGDAELVLSHASSPPSTERCSGDRKRLVRIPAPALAGTLGNAATRRLCVHLPRSYTAATARRYPVIYVLPGLMGSDTTRLVGGKVDELADELATSLGREAILVGVDTSTRAGSTYLVDSPTNGDFDTFFSKTMVAFVDATFRTLASPKARALLGQSTGGFNAVSAALRHSDVFTVVGSMSPDALDLESWLLAPSGDAVAAPWLRWMRIEDELGGGGQMVSYAADWSPEPTSPRGFTWPTDLKSGKLVPSVWAKWLAQSPVELLKRPTIAAGARASLHPNRIYITVSREDEFGLHAPAARFSDALRKMGIEHTFVATAGGHFAGLHERQVAALRHCLLTLPAATDG